MTTPSSSTPPPTVTFITRAGDLSASGLPLTRFTGRLLDIIPRFAQQPLMVDLPFDQLKDVVPDEGTVWTAPIALIQMRYVVGRDGKPWDGTDWGQLLKSADTLGFPDVMTLKGKDITMSSSMETYKDRTTGEARQAKRWRISAVAGAGSAVAAADGVGTEEQILALLHGKTISEFSQAILASPGLREKYLEPTMSGTLVAALVGGGKVVEEGRRLWVKDRPRAA